MWADEYHRAGLEALKINRKDQDAKYQTEIERLRAKIGQLVMDDDVRQEAMPPFLSGDQTSSVWFRQGPATAPKSLSISKRAA